MRSLSGQRSSPKKFLPVQINDKYMIEKKLNQSDGYKMQNN